MEVCWNFDYSISLETLERFYKKAKRGQWDSDEYLVQRFLTYRGQHGLHNYAGKVLAR